MYPTFDKSNYRYIDFVLYGIKTSSAEQKSAQYEIFCGQ